MQDNRDQGFTASKQQMAALRQLRFVWMPVEAGAPVVDPFQPFGSPDPGADLAAFSSEAGEAALRQLYCDAMNLLPDFVRAAAPRLAPGRYALDGADTERLREFMPSDQPGVGEDGSFDYTAEHAAVLPLLVWRSFDAAGRQGWEPLEPGQIGLGEAGRAGTDGDDDRTWPVVGADCKRPYGDMTCFELDMADALGIPQGGGEGDSPLPQPVLDRLQKLHDSTPAALRALVLHGQA